MSDEPGAAEAVDAADVGDSAGADVAEAGDPAAAPDPAAAADPVQLADPMDPEIAGAEGSQVEATHGDAGDQPVAAADGDAPAADVAPPRLAPGAGLDLAADDPWSEAGRKVLRFHLARMLARVDGVRSGEDPEDVHAMRVAARRMRAAWRVFGDGFERDAMRRYRNELRDVGGRLGAVRDMDVLIEILVDHGRERGSRQRSRIEPLLEAWRAEREARRVELIETLDSPRFGQFVADYEAFVLTPELAARPVSPHAPPRVRSRMPGSIWGAYGEVWAFDRHLGAADLATLHELRIVGKWLRYTLEFVREPLDPLAAGLIKPVVALQDHLGNQHDLHVASLLAREFVATSRSPERTEKAIARFVADLDAEVDRLGRTLGRTWRPIVAPYYRRTLGRALSRL